MGDAEGNCGRVSMIALGGPKLKLSKIVPRAPRNLVSMIALGGPKLKLLDGVRHEADSIGFNDSTGWA